MYSSPSAKQNQAEIWQRFQSFCFELNVLNKYSMPWIRCAFSNVLFGLWAGWILEITLFRKNMLCITSRISIWNSPKKERRKTKRNLITQVEAISTTAAWNLIYKYFCNNCSPSILAGPIWSNIFRAFICHSFALAMIELGGLMKVWRITGDQGVEDCTCLAMWGRVGAPTIKEIGNVCNVCSV